MIGKTILQYEVIEQLGEGGMGVVYKAKDTKLDRFVALKFLPSNVASTESDRARFLQEAKSAATLSHPNICTIYDVQEFEGQLFIAMEFIEGETLRARKNISFKQAIEIGTQVAEALAAAHEKGIVHRDIKPENVMLRKDGRAQIMDFGLAKQQGASRLTKQGSTVGTVGYMSPEQVQGFNVDHRTDIFSFGVLLYELVSGQSPFKGMHETAIIYEIVNVDPEPASLLKPDLPPDVDAILLECLAKDPDERYQSAKEIAKDLRKLKRESSKQTASRVLAIRQQSQIQSGVRPQTAVFETVQEKKTFSFNIWMIVSALSVLSLLVLLTTYFLFVKTEPELMRLSFESPVREFFNSTNGGHMEISPNGKMITFVATDSSGKNHLWIRPIQSPVPVLLQGTENATYPFWSYDSKMIAYFSEGKLKKIDANGGPSFTLCDAGSGRGGSWNKDGMIVFAPVSGGPLHQVPSAGGTSKQVTFLDSTESEVNHRWPYFLPDGDHFFYSVQTSKASLAEDANHIRVGSLQNGNGKVIIRATSNTVYNDGWVMFYNQNSLLAQRFNESSFELEGQPIPILENLLYSQVRSKGAFSLSRNNRLVFLGTSKADNETVIFDPLGAVEHVIKSKVADISATFSTDGKMIATDAADASGKNSDIWIHDIERNSDTRLTFDKADEIVPVWTADDKQIYFSSNRTGIYSVYVKNSNGTGDEQLVYTTSLPSYVTGISPDGKTLMISINTQSAQKWDLGLYHVPEKKYTPLLTSEFNEWRGNFSPDGKWYVYESDETGKYEIYIRPTDGSASKWQVSTSGGTKPAWLKNGKEIVFTVGNQQIITVPVAVSGNQILIGQSKILFKIDTGFQPSFLGVSVDGKKFMARRTLNIQALKSASLIFNWQNLVEKK